MTPTDSGRRRSHGERLSAALLVTGPPYSLKVLHCLHQTGVAAHVVEIGRRCATGYSRYLRRRERVVTNGGGGGSEVLREFLRTYVVSHGIDVIIPGDMEAAGRLFELKDHLGDVSIFPVSDERTLSLLDDKWSFYELARRMGIPVPSAWILRRADELGDLVDRIRFPALVKPLNTESSHGIVRMGSAAEIERYLRSGGRYASLPLMVQEHVPGDDMDISVLAVDGEIKLHIVQSRRTPGVLVFEEHPELLSQVAAVVREVRYSGVANFDTRIEEGTGISKLLECNPRFWYTLQASAWGGSNFVAAGISLAMGREPTLAPLVKGRYFMHGHLVRSILARPWCWGQVPRYNWQGFLQACADPMPFLMPRIRQLASWRGPRRGPPQ